MIRAVLDTNIFISGILWPKGNPRKILYLFRDKEIEIFCSQILFQEIILTLSKVVKRYQLSTKIVSDWFNIIQREVSMIGRLPTIDTCRDSNDNMIIATAIASEANFIITGDEDLLLIKKYKGIKILTARKFLEVFKRMRLCG